jgi:hypothetical protein
VAVAAGLLGAVVVAFQQSKEDDKNVATVSLWSASLKDWLLLVSGRVAASSAKSTVPLFQGLQDALTTMVTEMESQSKRWRVSKMLTSASFAKHFELSKQRVLELKNALRDFLTQEQQDAQDAALATIGEAAIATNEKLESMESQLGDIKALLVAQAEGQAAAAEAAAEKEKAARDMDTATEDRLFESIRSAADCDSSDGGGVPIKAFVMAFESFLLKGADLPSEVARGLRIAVDRNNDGKVTKLEFLKWWRQWQASEMTLDDFLLKCADEAPPTLYASVSGKASLAANLAASYKASAYAAAQTVDTAELKAAASAKAADAAAAAKAKATELKSGLGSMMFGGKSPKS